MKLAIFGKAQSGKGTFADLIAKDFGLKHFSAGEILREYNEKHKKIKEMMGKGILVPPEVIAEIMKKKLKGVKNFILDGYPRNMKQLNLYCPEFDKAVFLNVSDETVMKRYLGRRTCSKCGSIFNLNTETKPKKGETCDNCGTELVKREDDLKEESIKKRLDVYNKETVPVIEEFRKKGILIEINGNRTVDVIYADIKKILKE